MSNGAQTRYLSMVLNFNKKVTDDYLSNSVNEMKGGNSYRKNKKKDNTASRSWSPKQEHTKDPGLGQGGSYF